MRIHKTIRHVFLRGGFVCFLVGLYLLTGSSTTTIHATTTTAYAADSACITTTHCYGITRWYAGGSASFTGAYTSISTASISTNNYGTHIFTHEMWLNENSARCSASPYGGCWLEVGYGNFRSWYGNRFYAGMFYFWAETRPGFPTLAVHILGPVRSSQFGSVQNYYIRRINNSTYQIVAGAYTAYSTQNTMVANGITIGEELANTGGSALTSAQAALFTHTSWQNAYGWHFFQSTGSVVNMNPLLAGWVRPLPAGGPTFYAAW